MKNILFIHSSSELYGSDQSLLKILKNIDKSKFNIYVVLPCVGPLVDEIKKIPHVKIKIFDIAVLRRKNLSLRGGLEYCKSFCKSYSALVRIIRKYKIDIVETNTAVVFPGAVAAKACHIKSVWHIREIINNKIENYFVSFMMNLFSDRIIANSKSTGAALKVKNSKISVVYNAVEEKEDVTSIEHSYLTVGMAGRINRWKGQTLFVDAAEIVHKRLPDVVFLIAGDAYKGEEYLKDQLIDYIKNKKLENTIKLLGQVDDMASFYKKIDVFVLPSIQPEPFGLVVIEAMEYGIPVIATKHGGPTEIIEDKVDGYLVDYHSADEMAIRMEELLVDSGLRHDMGERARRKKKERFSVTAMVDKIEEIYSEL